MMVRGDKSGVTAKLRFRPRFRLRTFLVVVTIFCVWLGWHIHGTRRQREAVAAIRACGGEVRYDYQVEENRPASRPESWAPAFARQWWGVDFFHPVVGITFGPSASARSGKDEHSLPAEEIRKLPSVRFLILRDYAIDDEDLRHFGELTRLEVLSIKNASGLTDEGIAHLSRLRRLKVVVIRSSKFGDPSLKNRLGDQSLETFSQFPKLGTLRVWGTFTDEGVRHLGRLENLRDLSFAHSNAQHENGITDESLTFLFELPDFKYLYLSHTKVTPEFVAKVQARFPECKVYW